MASSVPSEEHSHFQNFRMEVKRGKEKRGNGNEKVDK